MTIIAPPPRGSLENAATVTSSLPAFALASDFPLRDQTTVVNIISPRGGEPLHLNLVSGVDIQITNEATDSSLALLKITEKNKPAKYQLRRVTGKDTPESEGSPHLITENDPVVAELVKVDGRFFINPQACTSLEMKVEDASPSPLPLYAKISGIMEKGFDEKGKPRNIETMQGKWDTLICLGSDVVTQTPVYLYHDFKGERKHEEDGKTSPGRAAKLFARFISLRPNIEEDESQPRKSRFSATSVQMKPGVIPDPETKSKEAKTFAAAADARKMLTVFPLALPPVPEHLQEIYKRLRQNVIVREATTITVGGTSSATTVSINHRLPILFANNPIDTTIKVQPLNVTKTQWLAKSDAELNLAVIAASANQPILLKPDYQPIYYPNAKKNTVDWFT